jgi:Lipocalin-like domain
MIAAGSIALLSASTSIAQTTSSSEQLQGTWTMVSIDGDHHGQKEYPFGDKPNGSLILDRGMVAVFIAKADRTKSAGHPSEPVGPVVAYYGTYSIDGDALTYHVKGSTYPNYEGTNQKASFSLSGDTLTLVRTITTTKEPFISTLRYSRTISNFPNPPRLTT